MCYNYKMSYISLMITTKKVFTDTQKKKLKQESKHHYTKINKIQRNTRKERGTKELQHRKQSTKLR